MGTELKGNDPPIQSEKAIIQWNYDPEMPFTTNIRRLIWILLECNEVQKFMCTDPRPFIGCLYLAEDRAPIPSSMFLMFILCVFA